MRNSTQYKLAGPVTFRRASSKILPEKNRKNVGWGSNLQNQTKALRSIYMSDGFSTELEKKCIYWLETGDTDIFTEEELVKLRVMAQCDQSGAEALAMAYDSKPGDYRELFKNNVKPHVYVALKLFPDKWKAKVKEHSLMISEDDIDILSVTPIASLKNNKAWKDLDKLIKMSDNWVTSERFYYFAKQTVHSGNYDIQENKFVFNVLEKSGGKIVIPKEEGRRFLQTYRGLFPEIPERNERIKQQVIHSNIIYNMLGFPYQITDYNISENTFKEFYAWGPQSTIGEITRIAFCDLQEYIENNNKQWDILVDNHDSYLTQGPLINTKERMQKMTEFMNQELTSTLDGIKFRMKSEINVGFNWGPFDKESNPLGLRELEWMN